MLYVYIGDESFGKVGIIGLAKRWQNGHMQCEAMEGGAGGYSPIPLNYTRWMMIFGRRAVWLFQS
jgi:hypothetical protein